MVKFVVLGKEYDSEKVCFTFGHVADLFIEPRTGKACKAIPYEQETSFDAMTRENTILPGFSLPVKKGKWEDLRKARKIVFMQFAEKNNMEYSILHDD